MAADITHADKPVTSCQQWKVIRGTLGGHWHFSCIIIIWRLPTQHFTSPTLLCRFGFGVILSLYTSTKEMNIQEAILEAHVYIPLEHKEMHSSSCSDLVRRKEFLHNSAHNKTRNTDWIKISGRKKWFQEFFCSHSLFTRRHCLLILKRR